MITNYQITNDQLCFLYVISDEVFLVSDPTYSPLKRTNQPRNFPLQQLIICNQIICNHFATEMP
jgi:hypothetical protein